VLIILIPHHTVVSVVCFIYEYGMQTQSSDENNSVCPSVCLLVCLSVRQMHEL